MRVVAVCAGCISGPASACRERRLSPPGTTAQISYFDADANVHLLNAPLPWSITLSTTLPTVSANIMAQGDGSEIGCRVTVNGTVREEKTANGINAQTYCLVKSA